MTLEESLAMYQARQDETGRIHLQCLCDGTLGFMSEMVALLRDCLHCKDIEMSDEIITEGISEDKLWCNCLMKASGMPTTGASIYSLSETKAKNRYEESLLHKWMCGELKERVISDFGTVGGFYWERHIESVVDGENE